MQTPLLSVRGTRCSSYGASFVTIIGRLPQWQFTSIWLVYIQAGLEEMLGRVQSLMLNIHRKRL